MLSTGFKLPQKGILIGIQVSPEPSGGPRASCLVLPFGTSCSQDTKWEEPSQQIFLAIGFLQFPPRFDFTPHPTLILVTDNSYENYEELSSDDVWIGSNTVIDARYSWMNKRKYRGISNYSKPTWF